MNPLWDVQVSRQFSTSVTTYSSLYPRSVGSEANAEQLPKEKAEFEALIAVLHKIKRLKHKKLDPETLPSVLARSSTFLNFRLVSEGPWSVFIHLDIPATKCRIIRLLHKKDLPKENIKAFLERALEEMLNG